MSNVGHIPGRHGLKRAVRRLSRTGPLVLVAGAVLCSSMAPLPVLADVADERLAETVRQKEAERQRFKALLSQIKTAYVKSSLRAVEPDGAITGPITTEWWVRYPETYRVRETRREFIVRGSQYWAYYKPLNAYHTNVNNPHPKLVCYPLPQFIPGLEGTASRTGRGADVSEKRIKARFKGAEYAAIETNIAKGIGRDGHVIRRRTVTEFVDPKTGLTKARIITTWNEEGDKVNWIEEVEYEYNNVDKPDDFFVFTPPPGAKELD